MGAAGIGVSLPDRGAAAGWILHEGTQNTHVRTACVHGGEEIILSSYVNSCLK